MFQKLHCTILYVSLSKTSTKIAHFRNSRNQSTKKLVVRHIRYSKFPNLALAHNFDHVIVVLQQINRTCLYRLIKANFYYHALNVLQNSCLKIQPQFHIINSVAEHNCAL